MDEVVMLSHHSISTKGFKNYLDMKCNLDERQEKKGNLFTKRTASQSKRTFQKSGKLTSPTSSFNATGYFGKRNSSETDFEVGVEEPVLDYCLVSTDTESRKKTVSPYKATFIQDMVDHFDCQDQQMSDKVVSQKINKMLPKGSLSNCDNESFRKITERGHQRMHTKSENSSDIVPSVMQLHPSKSLRPSPAPKPRKVPKDNCLPRNVLDESKRENVELEPSCKTSRDVDGGLGAMDSCANSNSLAINSALCLKPMAPISRSCGDLNQRIKSESSNDRVGKSFGRCDLKDCSAEKSTQDAVGNNTVDDSFNFEDDFDESDDERECNHNSAMASRHARTQSPSVGTARQSSSSSTTTLVAKDSFSQMVTRVPSFESLDTPRQLKVEYVNEADSEKSKMLDVPILHSQEYYTKANQNDFKNASHSFKASKWNDDSCLNTAHNIRTVDSNDNTLTSSDDDSDPPYEIMPTRQNHESHSRSNEPSSGSQNKDHIASDPTAEEVIPSKTDPVQGLDSQHFSSYPTIVPRLASPIGSPVLKPRKTSKGQIDVTLLSQVVLPPSPGPRALYAGSPTPPAIAPRLPARGSSQSTPTPSALPRKFSNAMTLQHSKSRRAPPPLPPPVAEVQPNIRYDTDVPPPPFIPQRTQSRHNSYVADLAMVNAVRTKRPSAGTLKGYEAKCVEVDSGKSVKIPARTVLSSASSQSMSDLRRKAQNRGSTLSLHVPVPSSDEPGEGQVSPSRSEGYLQQDGYLPMGSQRSTSTSSQFSSASDLGNEMSEVYMVHSPPSVPPRATFRQGRSSAMSYAASDVKGDEMNRLVMRDNSYLELQADEDYDKYSYLSLYNESEPLYQHYHQGAVVRNVLEQNIEDDGECDNYFSQQEYIEHAKSCVNDMLKSDSVNDYISREKMVKGLSTLETAAKLGTGFRKLWCEMPKVRESGLLDHMSLEERRLQESVFEILSSEASYLKSLNLLVGHFMEMLSVDIDNRDRRVLSKQDFNWLFSNAKAVRSACIKMLESLEEVWQQGCVINPLNLCSTITEVVQEHYGVYVTYCSNANYQERKLKELNERSPEFRYAVRRLEDFADCHSLPLSSFLALPMQRITRMPLLITAMCRYLKPDDASSPEVTRCIHVLQKIVKQCNEGARKMSNLEHMNKIDKILDFRSVKRIPLISESRHLVKKGFLVHIIPEPSGFLKKSKRNLFLFLFNDLLVITKRKSDKQFEVLEYSPRRNIHAQLLPEEAVGKFLPYGVPSGCKNLFNMALMDKKVEFVLSCESQSEQLRWIQAFTPVEQDTDDEVVYADWDCPQVQAVEQYLAREPDELSLEESDVVNVLRKINDGWYEGERIRDGERGWFPADCTVEIQNAHVRARNLRQQYQLLKNSTYGLSCSV